MPGEGSGLPGLSQQVSVRFLLTALPRVSLLVFRFPAYLLNVVTSGLLGMPRGRLRWLSLMVQAGHFVLCRPVSFCQVCVIFCH